MTNVDEGTVTEDATRPPRRLRVLVWIALAQLVPSSFLVVRLIKEMTLWTWQRGPQTVGATLLHTADNPLALLGLVTMPGLWIVAPWLFVEWLLARKRGGPTPRFTGAALVWAAVVLGLYVVPYSTWTTLTYSLAGPGPGGTHALRHAVEACDVEQADRLLAMDVPADPPDSALVDRDLGGLVDTPLLAAASSAETECTVLLRRLLDLDIDLDRRSSPYNESALSGAARQGHLESVRLLASKGASLDVRDRDGRTALEVAESEGHPDVAELLRELGGASTD